MLFNIPWCTSGGPQVEMLAMYAASLQCALSITEEAAHRHGVRPA